MISPETIAAVRKYGAIGWANTEFYADPGGCLAKYVAAGMHPWWRFWRKPTYTEVRRWMVSIGQKALDMAGV